MPSDAGTLNINSAGTPETFVSDRAGNGVIRGSSLVKAILFIAPSINQGRVFIGMIGRDGERITHLGRL